MSSLRLFLITVLIISTFVFSSRADEAASPKGRFLAADWQRHEDEVEAVKAVRKKRFEESMLAIYDQSKEGQLDDQELAQMNHDLKKHGDDFVKKYDLNQDGKVDPRELNAIQQEIRKNRVQFLQSFDKNDDGILDITEKATAHKEIEKRRAEFRAQFATSSSEVSPEIEAPSK